MSIEMGVIDRPKTVDESKIKVVNKMKSIEDIVVPSYPFVENTNDRDAFIRVEINNSNYKTILKKYKDWLFHCNGNLKHLNMVSLKRLCSDFGLDVTREVTYSSGTWYYLKNPKNKSDKSVYFRDSRNTFMFVLNHVKKNLDEYKQLVELYNYEVEVDKELATWREEIITCIDESIEEYKDKLVKKYKEDNFK